MIAALPKRTRYISSEMPPVLLGKAIMDADADGEHCILQEMAKPKLDQAEFQSVLPKSVAQIEGVCCQKALPKFPECVAQKCCPK